MHNTDANGCGDKGEETNLGDYQTFVSKIQELRLQRWERIRKGGIIKFMLIRSLGWIVLMCISELVMYALGEPRLAWYWMVPAVLFAGLLWGLARWFVIMWFYARAQKSKNKPN
jgi:hypothetical protein